MQKNKIIKVQNLPITISKEEIDDYICITDIAAAKSDDSRAADVVVIGSEIEERLSFWLLGRKYIIQILKCSNLNTLKNKRDY